jgi:hypothetical protein
MQTKVATVVYWVNVEDLKETNLNPDGRAVLTKALSALIDSMEDEGYRVEEPIIIAEDGTIMDGHRRFNAAKAVGINEITAVISTRNVADGLPDFNTIKTAWTGRDWLNYYVKAGSNPSKIPARYMKVINKIKKHTGMEGVQLLASSNLAPDAIHIVVKTVDRIKKERPNVALPDNYAYKVLEWAIRHNELLGLRLWLKYHADKLDTLMLYIKQNRDLPRDPK